ncbi:MAG: hypothetical protein LBT46_15550 [Planctomycetaceae bacterium]|nr:hypothetical protein [Planctomycetaceae bacterium]
MLSRIESIAEKQSTTVSAIIRNLIKNYVENEVDMGEFKKRLEALEEEVFKKKKGKATK